jgi:hypothetical protein
VNAALLLMGSAWIAGADAAAPAAPPAAQAPVPAVVTGNGCGGCGPTCNDCGNTCGRAGFLSRLKARGGHRNNDCCAPACNPCPPPPPCNPCPQTSCCDTGCGGKHGLFTRLRGRWSKGSCGCDGGPEPCCGAPGGPAGMLGTPGGPVGAPVAPPGGELPKEMPKGPTVTPKPSGAAVIPSAPIAPISGPRLNGTYSPY